MRSRHQQAHAPVAISCPCANIVGALDQSTIDPAVGGVTYGDSVAALVTRFPRVNSYNLACWKNVRFMAEQEVRIVHQDHTVGRFACEYVRAEIDLAELDARITLGPGRGRPAAAEGRTVGRRCLSGLARRRVEPLVHALLFESVAIIPSPADPVFAFFAHSRVSTPVGSGFGSTTDARKRVTCWRGGRNQDFTGYDGPSSDADRPK
jgi:hypothetical protein